MISIPEANSCDDPPQTVKESGYVILGKIEGAPATYFTPLAGARAAA